MADTFKYLMEFLSGHGIVRLQTTFLLKMNELQMCLDLIKFLLQFGLIVDGIF